ncbi:MAG: alpha/beta fold hydrolase [Leptolyngbyaceae cyanobacterium SM1_1_3]|nr:alpha/beta fold hydrolase [Leptolyngbyaceae cyanobacterium SM1_1_3]NJN05037.1 alpha/beta fold hydrolase [Leptolyngbyaceae cyanobacterium RM1_1_2]NJO10728.1 alpha/beta fold hydrolase [Leptolyngbyaceae cyanobacterium SL_1_1]
MSRQAQCWQAKNFTLQCGATLPQVRVVYQAYGELSGDRGNVILYPTSYGAQHGDIDWLIGPGGILDPTRWFILIPNMLGNGLSSAPSNGDLVGLAEQGLYFTHLDNVTAQERLLREVFGIEQLALVYGWSMGAQQAYHWGALYPDRVERIVALCGTARTTDHNRIFLESLRSALTADPAWNGSGFEGIPERGFRTFARIYASWAASQAFYREGVYYQLGYDSLEDYLWRGWELSYRKRHPGNLVAMLDTWLRCDVSQNPVYQGDYRRAMVAIRAKTLVMPGATDLYFTPEDCAAEAALIAEAEYRPIPSIWGHRAGNPYQNAEDAAFIRQAVQSWLPH